MGTFHASDIFLAAFGDAQISFPARSMQSYYIAFIHDLDPNGLPAGGGGGGGGGGGELINWPKWNKEEPKLMNFELGRNSLMNDDFRSNVFEYLVTRLSTLRI